MDLGAGKSVLKKCLLGCALCSATYFGMVEGSYYQQYYNYGYGAQNSITVLKNNTPRDLEEHLNTKGTPIANISVNGLEVIKNTFWFYFSRMQSNLSGRVSDLKEQVKKALENNDIFLLDQYTNYRSTFLDQIRTAQLTVSTGDEIFDAVNAYFASNYSVNPGTNPFIAAFLGVCPYWSYLLAYVQQIAYMAPNAQNYRTFPQKRQYQQWIAQNLKYDTIDFMDTALNDPFLHYLSLNLNCRNPEQTFYYAASVVCKFLSTITATNGGIITRDCNAGVVFAFVIDADFPTLKNSNQRSLLVEILLGQRISFVRLINSDEYGAPSYSIFFNSSEKSVPYWGDLSNAVDETALLATTTNETELQTEEKLVEEPLENQEEEYSEEQSVESKEDFVESKEDYVEEEEASEVSEISSTSNETQELPELKGSPAPDPEPDDEAEKAAEEQISTNDDIAPQELEEQVDVHQPNQFAELSEKAVELSKLLNAYFDLPTKIKNEKTGKIETRQSKLFDVLTNEDLSDCLMVVLARYLGCDTPDLYSKRDLVVKSAIKVNLVKQENEESFLYSLSLIQDCLKPVGILLFVLSFSLKNIGGNGESETQKEINKVKNADSTQKILLTLNEAKENFLNVPENDVLTFCSLVNRPRDQGEEQTNTAEDLKRPIMDICNILQRLFSAGNVEELRDALANACEWCEIMTGFIKGYIDGCAQLLFQTFFQH